MASDKKTILIVDDEIDVLAVLSARLLSVGYNVLKSDNGIDAIDISRDKKPDLIILDIMMPQMDGMAVAQHLKEDIGTKNIPIIFLTALQDKNEESYTHKSGGNIIFSKPYDTKELLGAIQNLIGLKQAG